MYFASVLQTLLSWTDHLHTFGITHLTGGPGACPPSREDCEEYMVGKGQRQRHTWRRAIVHMCKCSCWRGRCPSRANYTHCNVHGRPSRAVCRVCRTGPTRSRCPMVPAYPASGACISSFKHSVQCQEWNTIKTRELQPPFAPFSSLLLGSRQIHVYLASTSSSQHFIHWSQNQHIHTWGCNLVTSRG